MVNDIVCIGKVSVICKNKQFSKVNLAELFVFVR